VFCRRWDRKLWPGACREPNFMQERGCSSLWQLTGRGNIFLHLDHSPLWHMPSSVEQELDDTMIGWAHGGRSWPDVPALLEGAKKESLGQTLKNAGVLTDDTLEAACKLKLGPEGKSVRLPDVVSITDETVRVLAAGFVRGKSGTLLLPMVSVTGGDRI
jgi:hypothetical protein